MSVVRAPSVVGLSYAHRDGCVTLILNYSPLILGPMLQVEESEASQLAVEEGLPADLPASSETAPEAAAPAQVSGCHHQLLLCRDCLAPQLTSVAVREMT